MHVVFLMLGAVCLLATAAGTHAADVRLVAADRTGGGDGAISPDGRFILASSRRNGATKLWMYDIADRNWSQVTIGAGEDSEPYWAPDSRRAVFVSKRDGSSDLWIVDTVSRTTTQLTRDHMEDEYPAWSPDGRLIVYTGGAWGKRNFYIVDADGGPSRPLLAHTGNVGACSFGSDGRDLICHTYEQDWGDLIEVELTTGSYRRLTDSNHWYYKPAASPDGRWLAFTDIGEDGDIIRFMPRLSSPTTALPLPRISGRWPIFFEGGAKLFFHRQIDEGVELRLINRATHSEERITLDGWIPGRASSSPDGRLVAYCATSRTDGSSAVFVYDTLRKTHRRLAFNGEACFPAWSPDGSKLAVTLKQNGRWDIAVTDESSRTLRVLTASGPTYRSLNGPISWSPDGGKLTFAGTTRPYESDVFVADLASGRIEDVAGEHWYNEGPSFSADGSSIVFMSTRGGDWTWGLFALNLESRSVVSLLHPDFIERRYPWLARGDELWWVETDACQSTTFLTRRRPGSAPEAAREYPGVRWFEVSRDFLLLTTTDRRVEYWIADVRSAF